MVVLSEQGLSQTNGEGVGCENKEVLPGHFIQSEEQNLSAPLVIENSNTIPAEGGRVGRREHLLPHP